MRKEFDDIFSRLDTIHEHDRQTDGHRLTTKDRAYAYRSAIKIPTGSVNAHRSLTL